MIAVLQRRRMGLLALVLLFWGTGAFAQSLPGLVPASAAPAQGTFDIQQQGVYTTAPILLDGAALFRIANPLEPSGQQQPLSYRVSVIEATLSQILTTVQAGNEVRTAYSPDSFHISVDRVRDQVVLQATDETHKDPLPILTVTAVDARYHGVSVDDLASAWQETLQNSVTAALLKRQPGVQRARLERALRVGLGMLLATALATLFVVLIRRRIAAIENDLLAAQSADAERGSRETASDPSEAQQRHSLVRTALRDLDPRLRLRLLESIAAVVIWTMLLAWVIAVTWALFLFPQTTPLAYAVSRRATALAIIWAATGLVTRALDIVIAQVSANWRVHYDASPEERERQMLRVPTVARALGSFKTAVLLFIAVLSSLGEVGVPVGSVITIGGLAAIGFSLAAQNLIRDFVNGFLILAEDQYAVGDYVTLNTYSGLVEQLSLRMVQIRNTQGDLVTLSHSSVNFVANQSRNWSRVVFYTSLDPQTDAAKAIAVISQAVETLAATDAWRDAFLVPIEWIGIDQQTRDTVLIKTSVKTAPLRQFSLRREIQLRVREALAREKIALGPPVSSDSLN